MTKEQSIVRYPSAGDLIAAGKLIGRTPSGTPLQLFAYGLVDEFTTTATVLDKLEPNPILEFSTSAPMVAYILFTAECRVSKAGQQLKLVVDVNDSLVGFPGEVVLTATPYYESRSTLAMRSLPTGNHQVYARWCVSGGTGYIRNHACTVWLVSE